MTTDQLMLLRANKAWSKAEIRKMRAIRRSLEAENLHLVFAANRYYDQQRCINRLHDALVMFWNGYGQEVTRMWKKLNPVCRERLLKLASPQLMPATRGKTMIYAYAVQLPEINVQELIDDLPKAFEELVSLPAYCYLYEKPAMKPQKETTDETPLHLSYVPYKKEYLKSSKIKVQEPSRQVKEREFRRLILFGIIADEFRVRVFEKRPRVVMPSIAKCAFCFKAKAHYPCGNCFLACYCDADCLSSHWKSHRKYCDKISGSKGLVPATFFTSPLCKYSS